MQFVIALHPVAHIQAAVWRHGEGDGPEVSAALAKDFSLRLEAAVCGSEAVALDAMIHPRCDEQSAVPFIAEAAKVHVGRRCVADDIAGRLARASQHRQGAEALAIPRDERMQPAAPVAKLIPIIAT